MDTGAIASELTKPGSGGVAEKRNREFLDFPAGVVNDESGSTITTPDVLEHLADESAWRAQVEKMGITVPDGWVVKLTEMRYDPAAWHRDEPSGPAVTRPVWRYRFRVEPGRSAGVDAVALIKSLRPKRDAVKPSWQGEATLCVSWNDLQAGKSEGGGSEALVERFLTAVEGVKTRSRWLKKAGYDLGHLLIIGGGDIVDGCTIFPHQAHHIDLSRNAQINLSTSLVLEGLDQLGPLFSAVDVLVTYGNHGENRIDGHLTRPDDNDDLLVFQNAARVAERDRRLSHLTFHISHGHPTASMDLGRWRVTTTHGHVFGRSKGPVEKKAWDYFSTLAASGHPAGQADLFVTHHFHHHASRDFGRMLWVQTPALDGGSKHFTDYTNQYSEPGMLTWVTTDAHRYTAPEVL